MVVSSGREFLKDVPRRRHLLTRNGEHLIRVLNDYKISTFILDDVSK